MNRELKFRVWDEQVKKWYKGLGPLMYGDSPMVKEGYIIQQFTGMLDKNGKEIYEGDIVKTIYKEIPFAVVQYALEFCSYRLLTSDNKSFALRTYRYVDEKPVGLIDVVEEVIGNIFE